jgi:hypothetical protein
MGLSQRRFGEALQVTGFPEQRMSRLLEASGPSLNGLLDEAIRWLISHDVGSADFSVPLTLGLSDALAVHEVRDWARRELALDYVRAGKRANSANEKADTRQEMKGDADVRPDTHAS